MSSNPLIPSSSLLVERADRNDHANHQVFGEFGLVHLQLADGKECTLPRDIFMEGLDCPSILMRQIEPNCYELRWDSISLKMFMNLNEGCPLFQGLDIEALVERPTLLQDIAIACRAHHKKPELKLLWARLFPLWPMSLEEYSKPWMASLTEGSDAYEYVSRKNGPRMEDLEDMEIVFGRDHLRKDWFLRTRVERLQELCTVRIRMAKKEKALATDQAKGGGQSHVLQGDFARLQELRLSVEEKLRSLRNTMPLNKCVSLLLNGQESNFEALYDPGVEESSLRDFARSRLRSHKRHIDEHISGRPAFASRLDLLKVLYEDHMLAVYNIECDSQCGGFCSASELSKAQRSRRYFTFRDHYVSARDLVAHIHAYSLEVSPPNDSFLKEDEITRYSAVREQRPIVYKEILRAKLAIDEHSDLYLERLLGSAVLKVCFGIDQQLWKVVDFQVHKRECQIKARLARTCDKYDAQTVYVCHVRVEFQEEGEHNSYAKKSDSEEWTPLRAYVADLLSGEPQTEGTSAIDLSIEPAINV